MVTLGIPGLPLSLGLIEIQSNTVVDTCGTGTQLLLTLLHKAEKLLKMYKKLSAWDYFI